MDRSIPRLALLLAWACDDAFDGPSGDRLGTTTFEVRVQNVGPVLPVRSSRLVDRAEGAATRGPLRGGERYVHELLAAPGDRLSFATMFVDSNDWFYAFPPEGVALYDDRGAPVQGDLTDRVRLWDAGTEADERPGVGLDQPPRQPGPDRGASTDLPVLPVTDAVPFGELAPPVPAVIRVTLDFLGEARFRLTLADVSDEDTLTLPDGSRDVRLSPAVVVVHDDTVALFDRAGASEALERLAEDGDPTRLAVAFALRAGTTVALSPGVWAVHRRPAPLFQPGAPASEGLERLAEDGDPGPLDDELAGEEGVVRHGTFEAHEAGIGPTLPGGSHVFLVEVAPGERLSLATRAIPSDDAFYATPPSGVSPFDDEGTPLQLEVPVDLWDAGTEADPQRDDEDAAVRPVPDGAEPLQDARIRVSARPF